MAVIAEENVVLNIPVLRWGRPYQSLEVDEVLHFLTGEPMAKVSQANGGLIQRDFSQQNSQRFQEFVTKFVPAAPVAK